MPRYLTSTQVCQLLNVSNKSLYLWERKGQIPPAGRDRRGWRVYSQKHVEAIRRFLGPRGEEVRVRHRPEQKEMAGLSARNQLGGIVVSIVEDGILAEVVLRLSDGQEVVAVITRSALNRLGIKKGHGAIAVIKATEVMLFT